MLFMVRCLDHSDALPVRLANYEGHKAYLEEKPIRIVVSGPLLADDSQTMIGSLFIVEADSKGEVEIFSSADPFNAAGVWSSIEIRPFLMRMDNR